MGTDFSQCCHLKEVFPEADVLTLYIHVMNGMFWMLFSGAPCQDLSEETEPTKALLEDIDIQKKLDVLALADKLGNVVGASRLSRVSRETIHRCQQHRLMTAWDLNQCC